MISPLSGIRVVVCEGIGPGPLAGRMLADMGAEVTVIVRPQKGAVTEQLGGAGDNGVYLFSLQFVTVWN